MEAAYLQELRREGQALEIQAIRYVRDPVTARRIFHHIQHCTYDLNFLEGGLQQASFRYHALMPRLLAKDRLTERDAGLISSAYGKTLLSLSGIQDMQNSIREWIKSFVPEGEEMGDVSGSQIAGVSQAERLLLRLAPHARRVPFPLYRYSWLAPDYEARLIRQADEDRLLHADGPEDGEEGETETNQPIEIFSRLAAGASGGFSFFAFPRCRPAEACAPDLRFFSGSARATMLSYEKGALCPLPLPGRL